MPTLDITDDHADRIEALREELAAAHAGPYASVDREDALAYLLDLADAVDDPDRVAEPPSDDPADESPDDATSAAASATPFDRDRARDLLTARNRRRSDPDPDDPMDLSDIAAAFEITGRSEMTKGELVDAILDAAETLAADPFARVDVDLRPADSDDETADSDGEADAAGDDASEDAAEDEEGDAGGSDQLNAMMSLLDTHGDKWREADGDARYEVDLPDGSVETARTKDDVRALLFRNY
jgi:hypothetical protein